MEVVLVTAIALCALLAAILWTPGGDIPTPTVHVSVASQDAAALPADVHVAAETLPVVEGAYTAPPVNLSDPEALYESLATSVKGVTVLAADVLTNESTDTPRVLPEDGNGGG
jgi:hypothetical protein